MSLKARVAHNKRNELDALWKNCSLSEPCNEKSL